MDIHGKNIILLSCLAYVKFEYPWLTKNITSFSNFANVLS